jgi:hypothetical protein
MAGMSNRAATTPQSSSKFRDGLLVRKPGRLSHLKSCRLGSAIAFSWNAIETTAGRGGHWSTEARPTAGPDSRSGSSNFLLAVAI